MRSEGGVDIRPKEDLVVGEVGGSGEEIVVDNEEDLGKREVVKLANPVEPSQAEKEEHEMTTSHSGTGVATAYEEEERRQPTRGQEDPESSRKCTWISCSWARRRTQIRR